MARCFSCMSEYDESLGMCPHCGYTIGDEEIRDEHLYPGTYIAEGRYMVGKALGFGGFGVTYVGFDTLMEKKVAIKEYLPGEFSTRSTHQSQVKVYGGDKTEQFNLGMSKFVDEARKLARMDVEDGVVDVYDAFKENGTAYIVMEFLEGETLKERIDREGKLSVEDTEKILLPVFGALKSVHDAGVIHRDIAPDNLFITKDGKVKLLDFGAARFASATHSRSLTVIYKPGYSPEEQYESHGNQGPWTDVYALAATFYKCITGITPDTSLERRIKDTLKRPSSIGVKMPKNKETALLNALNIGVEKRTQSTSQFLDEYNSEGKVKRVIESFAKLDVGQLSLKTQILISAAIIVIVVGAGLVAALNPFKALTKDSVEVPEGQTRVPLFVNETLDSATEIAGELNIVLKQSDVVYSTEIPKGRILSQSVNAGNFINLEGVVEYVTSGGVKQIYVPEVSGTTEEDARQMLKNSGFQHISVEYEYSDDVAPGNIIGLRLTPGGPIVEKETNVDEGTAIIIVVSKGIDPSKIDNTVKFTVGNYVGKTLEEVQKEVSGYAGIYVDASEQRYTGKNDAGVILEQKTAAGTELSAGDENNNTVYLVVSKGIDYRRVPDIVVGKKYKDVVKELEAAGFTLGDIKSVYSKDMAAECVVSFADESGKALKEGQQLPAGTKIILTVNDAALAPTNTPTPTATPTPTKKPFIQPKATDTPTPMPTPTPTPIPTATNTPTPVLAESISLNRTSILMEVGETVYLSASVYPSNYDDYLSWRSDNDAVSVSGGTVTANRAGSATVTVYADRCRAECYVTVVSKGSFDYSDWSDELPSDYSASKYDVEERTLYRTKELETNESESDTMEGWEMYGTRTDIGDWGKWSSWQYDGVTEAENREIQGKNYYRYRDKQFTTGSTDTMNGWTLYNTTYTWSDYGAWSQWSTSNANASDSRQVETRVLYRYRTQQTVTEYGAWGGWSSWNEGTPAGSDVMEVEYATIYGYYVFICPNCGARSPYYGTNKCDGCKGTTTVNGWCNAFFTTPHTRSMNYNASKTYRFIDGQKWFEWYDWTPTTGHRYRTRSSYPVTKWSDWTDWAASPVTASSTREVETKVEYRYRDRQQIPTYHFWQWGNWSDWNATAVTASDNKEVETHRFSRYRDRLTTTVYLFRRWTDWSDYGTTPATAGDSLQVDTKKQYRYKLKR